MLQHWWLPLHAYHPIPPCIPPIVGNRPRGVRIEPPSLLLQCAWGSRDRCPGRAVIGANRQRVGLGLAYQAITIEKSMPIIRTVGLVRGAPNRGRNALPGHTGVLAYPNLRAVARRERIVRRIYGCEDSMRLSHWHGKVALLATKRRVNEIPMRAAILGAPEMQLLIRYPGRGIVQRDREEHAAGKHQAGRISAGRKGVQNRFSVWSDIVPSARSEPWIDEG